MFARVTSSSDVWHSTVFKCEIYYHCLAASLFSCRMLGWSWTASPCLN